MAIVVKFDVSGMSVEKYEAVLRQLEAAGLGAPEGRLHHLSYGSTDNLQVIDVFESQDSLERFGRALVPILGALGIQAKPEISAVHKIIQG